MIDTLLVSQGLVLRQDVPPASLYTLNRRHVAAPAVETLAPHPYRVPRPPAPRLRELEHSAAARIHVRLRRPPRRGIDSDIDIFVVRPAGVDPEDATWDEQLHDLGDAIFAWTGNHAGIIDFAEQDVAQLQDASPPVLQDLRRDGVDLAGTSLRELLGSTR